MGSMENKILDILNKAKLEEAVEWETVGGPTPSETLKGPLDYAKNVKQAHVPSAPGQTGAQPIPGVGEIGDDEADENDPITDVVDNMDEDEDHDDDNDDDDKEIEETFASLLARLAEDEAGETSLKDADDDFGTPDETLPDVDSKLDNPDELATAAPGAKKPNGVSEDETYSEPKETLVGDEIDSMMDEPDKLVTQAPGAKSPGGVSEDEDKDDKDDEDDDEDEDDDKKDVSEDINAIFSGVKLSESGRAKAATIFQAAVIRRVNEEKSRVQKVATKKLKEAFEILKNRYQKKQGVFESKLTNQVDQYLNFVVENWLKENRIAVERGIRAELAEDFITGLKKLFVEHYIEVPESKVDVVATLGKKVTNLEAKLDESVQTSVKMRASLNAYRKEEVIRAVSAGLADTQRDKLKKLAEGVNYTTRKDFAEKLQSLKESYFPKTATPVKKDEKPLTEEKTTPQGTSSSDSTIAAVLKTTAKMNRR